MEKIINALKSYTQQSSLFSDFNYGEEWDVNINGNNNYPQMFVEEPFTVSLRENDKLGYSFALLLMNTEDDDYKKNTPKIDRFIKEILPIKEYLLEQGYFAENIEAVTLRDFSSDKCCGLRLEITLLKLKDC